MSEPFLGEIRVFSINFAPRGWAQCNGQLLPINQNQALFSILGTRFGGDGRTTFALPDLRGRAPMHPQASSNVGQTGGEESHVLTVGEMPVHTHQANAGSNATANVPAGNVWGTTEVVSNYTAQPNAQMNAAALTTAGQSQGHPNMQPYLVLNYCIATQGIFPTQN